MTRNIKLTIAYDGTAYHGFQRQENAMGIQQVLEEQLAKLFGHALKITGAGRTDAGVHAYGQVVNFYTTGRIPVDRIVLAAKGVLPEDIVVVKAEAVPEEFHARHSAKSKIYVYRMYQSRIADPFLRRYAWQVSPVLDISAMQAAMQSIVGTHDFSAFKAAGGAVVDPVRTIYAASCLGKEAIVECRFWGNGFLYHMVRNLVGTLVDVGRRKITGEGFTAILSGCDRRQAGITAPPQGLYLQEVLY